MASDVAPLIAEHHGSRWAVDVPFGWPDRFVALMASRHNQPLPVEARPADADWETWRTRQVAQRVTDAFVTEDERIKTRPLLASFQLLGATAAMWVLIEAQLTDLGVPIDRAGIDGNVCETYPSAALSAWHLGKAKQTWPELQQNFSFLKADQRLVDRFSSDDVCDAVVCALIARARDLNLTILPAEGAVAAARREGWPRFRELAGFAGQIVEGQPTPRRSGPAADRVDIRRRVDTVGAWALTGAATASETARTGSHSQLRRRHGQHRLQPAVGTPKQGHRRQPGLG